MKRFNELKDADQGMHQSMQDRLNQQLAANQDQNEAYAAATHSPAFDQKEAFKPLQEVDPSLYEQVLAACQKVEDPELGLDLYNLGLIYDLLYDGRGNLWIKMTLTMPGCPLADVIFDDLSRAQKEIPAIEEVKIELVWSPAWHPERLSRYARMALGFM